MSLLRSLARKVRIRNRGGGSSINSSSSSLLRSVQAGIQCSSKSKIEGEQRRGFDRGSGSGGGGRGRGGGRRGGRGGRGGKGEDITEMENEIDIEI